MQKGDEGEGGRGGGASGVKRKEKKNKKKNNSNQRLGEGKTYIYGRLKTLSTSRPGEAKKTVRLVKNTICWAYWTS